MCYVCVKSFIEMLVILFLVILIVALSGGKFCYAKPCLLIPAYYWRDKLPIFVANCPKDKQSKLGVQLNFKTNGEEKNNGILDWILVANPIQQYPSAMEGDYVEYKKKYKNREAMIYALVKHNEDRAQGKDQAQAQAQDKDKNNDKDKENESEKILTTFLYQIQANNNQETQYFTLDKTIKKGQLASVDVYFDNHWHTLILVILLVTSKDTSSASITSIPASSSVSSSASASASASVFPSSSVPSSSSASISSTSILIFDVTHEKQKLTPLHMVNLSADFKISMESLAKVKLAHMNNNEWFAVMGGILNEEGRKNGAVLFLPLTKEKKEILLFKTTEAHGITSLVMVDRESRGKTNQLIALDSSGQLWNLCFYDQLKEVKEAIFEKITKLNMNDTYQPLYPIQSNIDFKIKREDQLSERSRGLDMYLLAKSKENQDALMVVNNIPAVENAETFSDGFQPLENSRGRSDFSNIKIEKICGGHFSSVYHRFGRIFLLPNDNLSKPKILRFHNNFEDKRWVDISKNENEWEVIYSDMNLEKEEAIGQLKESILTTKLLWDPDQQREVFIILNDSCQLSILGNKRGGEGSSLKQFENQGVPKRVSWSIRK